MRTLPTVAVLLFLLKLTVFAQAPVCLPFSCQSVVVAGASQTIPQGVNAAGDVVGQSSVGSFYVHGGNPSTFAAPAGNPGVWGIGADKIVGAYGTPDGVAHGFIVPTAGFTNFATFTTIDVPGAGIVRGQGTVIYGANESGDVVGQYSPAIPRIGALPACSIAKAFVLHAGGFYTFCAPGSAETYFLGINKVGDIVGWIGAEQSFLLRTANFTNFTSITTLAFPGASKTLVRAINSGGDIVGRYTDTVGNTHGFILRTSNFTNFTNFSTVDVQGATFTALTSINDAGRMTGYYQTGDGNTYGFVADQNLGIDISRSAGSILPLNFWSELKQQGVSIVVVQAWGGRSRNENASGQLEQAGFFGHLNEAAFVLLNYDNRICQQDPNGNALRNADGKCIGFVDQPNPGGRWQVQQAIAAVGSERQNLKFIAIDVEPIDGETIPLSLDAYAQRNQYILDAIDEAQNAGLQPLIYSRRIQNHWPDLTGNATLFAAMGIPLWDVELDMDSELGNFVNFGGWTARIGKQYDLGPTSNGTTCTSFNIPCDRDVFSASLIMGSTPAGGNIAIHPIDSNSGTTPVGVTFASVATQGTTWLRLGSTGQSAPSGFTSGSPPAFYDIFTNVSFAGSVGICINYAGKLFVNQRSIRLFHLEAGIWTDRTVSLDTSTKTICASVTSLSPFAIFEPAVVTSVAVPNVVGLTQAAATAAITGAGLVLGSVNTASSNTVAAGSVISESPAAGAQVSAGSMVNVVVSTGVLPPPIVSVSPINGSGSPQTFNATFSSPSGTAALFETDLLINSSLNGAGACWVYYLPGSNTLRLINDAGTGSVAGAINPGSAGTLSNSQCTVSNAGAVTISGNNLTLPLTITFAPGFVGTRTVYGYASSSSGPASGWQSMGAWTVNSSPPAAVSVSPINGSGSPQTFNATFSSPNGTADISETDLLINSSLNGAGACWVYYLRASNTLRLINDAGTGSVPGSINPGSAGTLSNSQCTVSNAGAVTISGNNLTLPLNIAFLSGFGATRTIFGYVANNEGLSSGWKSLGTWAGSSSSPPAVISITPINGNGSPQTFNAIFSSPAGVADFAETDLLFNSSFSGTGACWIYYQPGSNSLRLINDAGTASVPGSINPGTAGSLSNSQCTVANAGAVTISGNNLTLPLTITFGAGFTGTNNVYGYASNNEGSGSGWQLFGTWTGH